MLPKFAHCTLSVENHHDIYKTKCKPWLRLPGVLCP